MEFWCSHLHSRASLMSHFVGCLLCRCMQAIFKKKKKKNLCRSTTSEGLFFFRLSLSAQIILHSMHKYQPRVHVIRKECGEELSPVRAVPAGEGTRTFSFPETVFTTVTAYQNQQVAHLTSTRPHFLLTPCISSDKSTGCNGCSLQFCTGAAKEQ